MPTSRPDLLGGLRPPAPQAAVLTRGHAPPDPHGTGTGPGSHLPADGPGSQPSADGPGSQPSAERAPTGPGCPKAPGGHRPLPDPVAVRLCRIPDPAPPYDGETPPGTRPAAPGTGAPANPDDPRPRRDSPGPAPSGFPGWPSRFAQVLAETLAGSRPPDQMVPWTTELARVHIQRLGPRLASGQRPRVRRVVTFHPTSDVMEMTVVVGFGVRVHALAVRLERADSPPQASPRRHTATHHPQTPRWLCTAIEAA